MTASMASASGSAAEAVGRSAVRNTNETVTARGPKEENKNEGIETPVGRGCLHFTPSGYTETTASTSRQETYVPFVSFPIGGTRDHYFRVFRVFRVGAKPARLSMGRA